MLLFKDLILRGKWIDTGKSVCIDLHRVRDLDEEEDGSDFLRSD